MHKGYGRNSSALTKRKDWHWQGDSSMALIWWIKETSNTLLVFNFLSYYTNWVVLSLGIACRCQSSNSKTRDSREMTWRLQMLPPIIIALFSLIKFEILIYAHIWGKVSICIYLWPPKEGKVMTTNLWKEKWFKKKKTYGDYLAGFRFFFHCVIYLLTLSLLKSHVKCYLDLSHIFYSAYI